MLPWSPVPQHRLVALIRFLFKASDRALSLFQILTVNKKFEWTTEYEEGFQKLNKHVYSLVALTKPVPDKPLFLY